MNERFEYEIDFFRIFDWKVLLRGEISFWENGWRRLSEWIEIEVDEGFFVISWWNKKFAQQLEIMAGYLEDAIFLHDLTVFSNVACSKATFYLCSTSVDRENWKKGRFAISENWSFSTEISFKIDERAVTLHFQLGEANQTQIRKRGIGAKSWLNEA